MGPGNTKFSHIKIYFAYFQTPSPFINCVQYKMIALKDIRRWIMRKNVVTTLRLHALVEITCTCVEIEKQDTQNSVEDYPLRQNNCKQGFKQIRVHA